MTVYRAAIGVHRYAQNAAHAGACANFATTRCATRASELRHFWRDTTLVVRSIKTETNEIDGFFRQARRTAAAVLKYGKDGQRSMAEKDAISCLCFGGTDY